tara:strand:- start:187 stop:1032 length:846 start_codon:yes stop_codon:yes gene_type:complete
MANRFPLIVDSSALQIKEIPSGDSLDLTGNSIVNVVDITASGNISVGGTLTYEDVNNVDSVGLITARTGIKIGPSAGVAGTFFADGSYITAGIITAGTFIGTFAASNLVGALPAIDGSALEGLPVSGVGIKTAGATVGFGVTFLDFRGSGVGEITSPNSGITTINISGGGGGGGGSISTDAHVVSGITTVLDLSNAQDHKITTTGNVTISCVGGNEGESHTVRIINSGSATVGFSTFFLFPSGSTPVLPTGSGDISLISFTINRVGAAGTQLLAGASLNFS